MTRGKQKIKAQRKNGEKNQKQKGSQLEATAVALKITCPICKVQLVNQNQLNDHYGSKHPKEKPPTDSSSLSWLVFCRFFLVFRTLNVIWL